MSGTLQRSALISPDGVYRYWLTRSWDPSLPHALFCMLNPSTADHETDDHTVRKDTGFCKSWGFGSFTAVNPFGYRATDPDDLAAAAAAGVDIIGPDNLQHIERCARDADLIVAAWGASVPTTAALHMHRVTKLLASVGDVFCLGTTRGGAPRHPLMVGYSQPLELFAARSAVAS